MAFFRKTREQISLESNNESWKSRKLEFALISFCCARDDAEHSQCDRRDTVKYEEENS